MRGLTILFHSKGDGERAMIEASNELRVVRGELENLMDLIATKVRLTACVIPIILYLSWLYPPSFSLKFEYINLHFIKLGNDQ